MMTQDWLSEKDMLLTSHLEHELTVDDLPDETQVASPADVHSHSIRRIKTEEKSKVVAAVWGTEVIQILAALAILRIANSSFSTIHHDAICPILPIILQY